MRIFKLFSTIACLLLLVCEEAAAQSAIYACGHIRRHREVAIDNLRNSGYTTVILFNVTVEPDGTLTTDYNWSTQTPAEAGGIICKDGEYVFDEYQPFYKDDVRMIMTAPTSVQRLEICIGGWTNGSYGNIKKLVESQGTDKESILYRNFKALKEALPLVEAVNNDQEQDYDVESAIAFHKMMYSLGYKTTIAPYTRKAYWQQMVEELNGENEICDRVYLQMYGGGASNTPSNWQVFGDVPMYVGFDCEANSNRTAMTNSFNRWAETENIEGGFLWNYNSEDRNHNQWAANINRIFNHNTIENPAAIVYENSNFKGYSVELAEGTYNQSQLAVMGIAARDISSFKLYDGYKITLFTSPEPDSNSQEWTESVERLDSEWNNKACSLKIESSEAKVTSISNENTEISYDGKVITLKGISREDAIRIYDIYGRLIFEDKQPYEPYYISADKFSEGIYIVKAAGKTLKIKTGQ